MWKRLAKISQIGILNILKIIVHTFEIIYEIIVSYVFKKFEFTIFEEFSSFFKKLKI